MVFMDKFRPDNDPLNEQTGPQGNVGSVLELVAVDRVYGNMLVMKDGTFRVILRCDAVNFDLKSGREQNVLLRTYGELLNALDIGFPIQVLLHAAAMDTQTYVREYAAELRDPNLTPQMRKLIEEHIKYFEQQARDNYLLDRSYFVVIPYFGSQDTQLADGGVASEMALPGLVKLLDRKKIPERAEHGPSARELQSARMALMQRAGNIANQLSRLTITARLLSDLEIVALLKELYNPGISERQKLRSLDGINDDVISIRVRDPEQGGRRALPRAVRFEDDDEPRDFQGGSHGN